MNIKERIAENAKNIEKILEEYLKTRDFDYAVLFDAQRYSTLIGGKRIRPFLAVEFCKLFNGDVQKVYPFAAAIECVHTSSLIHDDMPCMDNDDLRRGKPTNHKVFGEAVALLSGMSLITYGYSLASDNPNVSEKIALKATSMLMYEAGIMGMMGGQMLDLQGEKEKHSFELLQKTHKKKTGALIKASCLLGCYAAGVIDDDDEKIKNTVIYAENIGLAFQIIDDILDKTGDVEKLGKNINMDENKTTYLSFFDVDEAYNMAKAATENAINAIKDYENSEALIEFAKFLLDRKA